MSTATKEAPKTKEAAKVETPTQAVAVNGKTITRQQAIDALKAAKEGDVDSGYLEFEAGDVRRVVFLGITTIQGIGDQKGTDVPAMQFLVDNGKEQINADAVIVSYFQRQQVGCIRQITCKGDKTSAKGKYKTFEIRELIA